MSHAKEFSEKLAEFGRLQYEAGRVACELEHHYGMAFVMQTERQPATVVATQTAVAPPPRVSRKHTLAQLMLTRILVTPGAQATTRNLRAALSKCMGEPITTYDLQNALRHNLDLGLMDKVEKAVYRRRNGAATDTIDAQTGES